MKNKYLISLGVSLLFLSCAEDKGNYTYTHIDEITIDSIKNNYTKVVGDSLSIPVTLTHSAVNKSENLSYLWEINNQKVAETKDLNILTPSDMSFGNKIARYTITDNNNGMKFYKTFSVNIVSPFNWGYYILTEKEDHSTRLYYFSVMDNNTKFIYTTSVNGIEFGNYPQMIKGSFGYISSLEDYFWSINILTKEGDNPVIMTENATFIPTATVNSSNFTDQSVGYTFAPEFVQNNRQGNVFFVSQGKFVSYTKGLLYRPAQHKKEYYWSYPIWSQAGYPHMFVFDELSQKYYVIKSQPNVPEEGIIGDSYAYDRVVEIKNCPDFSGQTIIGNYAEFADGKDYITVVTANTNGIDLTKLSYISASEDGNLESKTTLSATGADNDSQAIIVTKTWYFSVGNAIYTSPILLPTLSKFIDIPTEYGKIVNIQKSALESQLIVTTYDKNSSSELKGSVIFIDIQTKKMTAYTNVIDKCISIMSCNSDGFGWGDYGDGK